MVMVHGDNQGLVLPPRVASVQVIVVPCGITAKTTDDQRAKINGTCEELAKTLKKAGLRAKADLREGYTPGYKFNDWEQKVRAFDSLSMDLFIHYFDVGCPSASGDRPQRPRQATDSYCPPRHRREEPYSSSQPGE